MSQTSAPTNPPLRVGLWSVGNVTREAVRALTARKDLALVAALVRSPEKVGQDVGRLCGLDDDLGVVATDDVEALLGAGLDAVIYAPLHFDVDQVVRLLDAGINVVTSAEFVTGANLTEARRNALQDAARAGGATLFGSGMNPGFAQLLAGVGAGVSSRVERVVVTESVDVSQFVSDANFEAVGWGRPPNDPGHAEAVQAGVAVFAEAVHVLGRLLGVEVDGVRCEVGFAHATEDVEVPGLRIPAGHVAGMDVNWIGELAGRDVVEVRQRWLATKHLEPAWSAEHGYLVEITGDPNVKLRMELWPTEADLANLTRATMHGIGMRITAVPVVNAIPAVCRAAPGIADYADLPVITSPLIPRPASEGAASGTP